jgi:hypothetical protein
MPINRGRPTVNTKNLEKEPREASKVIFMRLPYSIVDRVDHQKKRLSCSMNVLTRMALVRFLEEEETIERRMLEKEEKEEEK